MQRLIQYFERNKESIYGLLFFLFILFDFYFMYVRWGPYPPRNYLSLALTPFALYECYKLGFRESLNRYFISIVYIASILFYILIYFIFTQKFIASYFAKDLLKFGTLLLSLTFLVPKVKTRHIANSIFLIVGFSLTIAYFQKFESHTAYEIRRFISDAEFHPAMIVPSYTRPPGLAYYTLTLSEQIFIFLAFALYALKKSIKSGWSKAIIIIIISRPIYLINNRGGLIALLIFYLFAYKELLLKYKKVFLISIPIIVPLVALYLKEHTRLFNYYHGNDSLRLDVWMASLLILKENFLLGLGDNHSNIKDLVLQTKDQMPFLLSPDRFGTIGPHNFFINMLLKFGILGLGILILIYKRLIKQALKREALLFYLIVTAISAMAHNGGLWNTSTLAIGMISLCFYHNELQNKEITPSTNEKP